MKKVIIALLFSITSLQAQDTVYLNGTNQVNFDVHKSVTYWFASCTQYSNANTERDIAGFGKVVFRTNGTGYVKPVANATSNFKYYNKGCGLFEYFIVFMQPNQTPDTTQTDTSKNYTIMSIGDSNTEGYGWSGSYRQVLDSLLGSKYDFIGRKTNGNFSDNQHEGYSGIDIDALKYDHVLFGGMFTNNKPDVILLLIGTNDVNDVNGMSPNNDPIAEAPERLRDLVTAIQSKTPNSKIIVISLIPIYSNQWGNGNTTKVATFNSRASSFLSQNSKFGTKLFWHDLNGNFSQSDYSDGLHLTRAGYAKFAGYIYGAVKGIE